MSSSFASTFSRWLFPEDEEPALTAEDVRGIVAAELAKQPARKTRARASDRSSDRGPHQGADEPDDRPTLKRAARVARKLEATMVHTKTDQTIRGVLKDVGDDALVLTSAALATRQPGTGAVSWARMDGEVVVALENIDFWQTGLPAMLLERVLDTPER